jgi:hypothetical protein
MHGFKGSDLVRVVWALLAGCWLSAASASQRFDWNNLISAAPSWPIVVVGKEIPSKIIDEWRANAYRCAGKSPSIKSFPSKAKEIEVVVNGQKVKQKVCDDGDATLFLGMLCISGDDEACDHVRTSQVRGSGTKHEGQWYRSPNRAFLGLDECPKGPGTTPASEKFYCQECVNAFSPDMALGVALYLFKSDDMAAFKAWSRWMESNAKTTTLQWKGGKTQKFPWPRLCDLDSACKVEGTVVKQGKPAGPVSSGACFLLPNHAPDFEYLDSKVEPDWGATTRKALANSKHIKALLATTVSGATGVPLPGVVIDDLTTRKGDGFANHLEAVRVLIKMVAVNPELKFETLPPVPSSASALAGPWDPGRSEDPAMSHQLASNVYKTQEWNAFYRLLAEGAVPAVHDDILARCPKPGAKPGKQDTWMWNTKLKVAPDPGDSMGWDCVFVAQLYNKMRVSQNFRDELFRKFDPVNKILQDATAAVEHAKARLGEAQALLNSADAALRNAKRVVDSNTSEARKRLTDGLAAHQSDASDASASAGAKARELANHAPCLPGDPVCKAAKKVLRDAISAFNRAARTANGLALSSTAAITKFDRDLQRARTGLENGALEKDVQVRTATYNAVSKELSRASSHLQARRKEYGRAAKYLGMWSGKGETR